MTATPYKPVSFTSESINQTKLQQMASNDQWLFENMAKMRYATQALTRDAGVRVISGKTPFAAIDGRNYIFQNVYFGSFFTAGCKPIVSTGLESNNDFLVHRSRIVIQGLGGEVDHRGFQAVVSNDYYTKQGTGWIHWQAIGY